MATLRVKQMLCSTSSACKYVSVSCFSSSPQIPQTPFSQNPDCEAKILSVASILREQRSKSRWDFIKSLYPNGFSPSEVSQIILRLRNNAHLALRFFLWSEKKSLCTHDLLSYSTIIHILARARLKSSARALIQTAIRVSEVHNGGDPDVASKPPKIFETLAKTYRSCDSAPFVFDLLIEACLQARKVDRSIAIVRMLRSRKINPTIHTCNSLIRLVSRLRGSAAGFSIYREVFGLDEEAEDEVQWARVSPNVQTFNTLMLSSYQDGLMGKVGEVWNEMEKFSCVPNVNSYSILMAALCDEGKMAEALRLWEEMRIKKVKPDIAAYNTLLSGFCKTGQIEKAEELFREITFSEVEATCLTYEHLINGYRRTGDIGAAILLYKDLCRKDFRPDASTIDAMIGEMCGKSKVSKALDFLRDVIERWDFSPSRTSYETLIRGLCMEGRMEEALKLQAEMVGRGFGLNSEIYIDFIDGYLKEGDEDMAERLKKEMFGIQQHPSKC